MDSPPINGFDEKTKGDRRDLGSSTLMVVASRVEELAESQVDSVLRACLCVGMRSEPG